MRTARFLFVMLCCLGMMAYAARADTYKLNDGKVVTGDIVSFNDNGIMLRQGDGNYSERIPWGNFSQDDLKELAKNEKIAPLVEPFIEPPAPPRPTPEQISITEPPRLARPVAGSLLGAMFTSSVGLLIMLVLYAANIYAAFEIAIFRARPPRVLCGFAAIPFLGVIANIVFLSMATVAEVVEEEEVAAPAPIVPGMAPAAAPAPDAPRVIVASVETVGSKPAGDSQPIEQAQPAGGLRLAHEAAPAAAASAPVPATQTFQRGAFTFNRRFMETKFPGFFGVVRREADKNMVLLVKSMRGMYVGERIARISASDFHLEVHKGNASEEIVIPFTEVQEIQLKHRDA